MAVTEPGQAILRLSERLHFMQKVVAVLLAVLCVAALFIGGLFALYFKVADGADFDRCSAQHRSTAEADIGDGLVAVANRDQAGIDKAAAHLATETGALRRINKVC